MTKYRKKPVTIEAFQMTKEMKNNYNKWPNWLREAWDDWKIILDQDGNYIIKTLEGRYVVSLNDWIIRGVKGELYPCKPDIFEMTYERVD